MSQPKRERVGPYRLLRRLGAGGMGEVFEARTPEDGARVCIKTIRSDLGDDPGYVRMFQDEARIHMHLRHEHIVRVLGAGEAEGEPYLVLELIEGASLEVLLEFLRRRGEVAPAAVSIHVIKSLAEALDAAHTFALGAEPQGLVHRDVSPANVLIGRAGEVKLSDFGIAKAALRTQQTTTGVVRGKLAYMSPEQVRGEPVDQRSDLFSLGIIAYELFAGIHPFRVGRDTNDIVSAHRMLLGARDPLSLRAPWLPASVCSAIEQLLQPEPSARPARADKLVKALSGQPHEADGQGAVARLVTRVLSEREADELGAHGATRTVVRAPATPPKAPKPLELLSGGPKAGELVRAYLDGLPAGLYSYPNCQARGSLIRAYLSSKPLDDAELPEELSELVKRPPVSGAWVNEVSFLSLALAVRAHHFKTDEAFLYWVKQINAQLFQGPLYRALMMVGTTRLLVAGAALRWRQFHIGTTLVAEHGDGNSIALTFGYPRRLFAPLHVALFARAIEAAIEAAGAVRTRTGSIKYDEQSAQAVIVW